MSKPRLPYLRFFPSDWLSDECLKMVSFAARGLWIDLLCNMAKNEQRGYLTLKGGVIPTLQQTAKLLGSTELEIDPLLQELRSAGVFSVDEKGRVFCRRLIRDTEAYEQSVKFGKEGGNPSLKGGVIPPRYPSLDMDMVSKIYQTYPRRVGKVSALKAIRAAARIKPPSELLASVTAYAGAVAKWPNEDRARFVPYPATWFNRGSYDDDRATWQRNGNSPEPARLGKNY